MFPTLFLMLTCTRGRLARRTFFMFLAGLTLAATAFGTLALAVAGNHGAAAVALPYLWCATALSVRRLHDTGRPGGALLLFAVPLLGACWLALALLRRGEAGPNRYGSAAPAQRDYQQVDIHR